MKLLLMLIVLVGPQVALVNAQYNAAQASNLSGIWSYKGDRGRPTTTLTISQTADAVRIVQEVSINGSIKRTERLFYTDGRGEENSQPGAKPLHSKTTWKEGKLDVQYISRKSSESTTKVSARATLTSNSYDVINQSEWTLSKDGQTLTQTNRHWTSPPTVDAGSHDNPSPTNSMTRVRSEKIVYERVN